MMDSGRKVRIGILFGGRSGEHEVSLNSARSVLAALDPTRYDVVQIGILHSGEWVCGGDVLAALDADALGGRDQAEGLPRAALLPFPRCQCVYRLSGDQHLNEVQALELLSDLDVVFPVLHGTFGEDGTLQGLLELADLAYVGAGVLGSALGMDKAAFKDVMRANGIPVLPSTLLLRSQIEKDMEGALQAAEGVAGYPLFVKPANLGSSVGISKCKGRSDLMEGLMEAARFDRRVLVERGINGREIEVSVLGNDAPIASVPGEILPSREFYSYEAKYVDNASGLLIPAPLDDQLAERVRALAVQAYQAIDCAGLARVDFLLDRDSGELFLNEINTIPGFTSISMYPKLWEASGVPYPELIDRLVELAMERKFDRQRTERRYRREG